MVARYLGLWSSAWCDSPFDDEFGDRFEYVVCVKCSSQYPTPSGYSCLETGFGIVVIKSYSQNTVTAGEARSLCAADAKYVHLPIPQNAAQNKWYMNYAEKIGIDQYWLGINDATVKAEWRTDSGDLQTYLPWKSGLVVILYRHVEFQAGNPCLE